MESMFIINLQLQFTKHIYLIMNVTNTNSSAQINQSAFNCCVVFIFINNLHSVWNQHHKHPEMEKSVKF